MGGVVLGGLSRVGSRPIGLSRELSFVRGCHLVLGLLAAQSGGFSGLSSAWFFICCFLFLPYEFVLVSCS